MILLLFLALWHCTAGALSVACLSQTDYHALLYRICSHSLVCSRIYYLDHFSPRLIGSNVTGATPPPLATQDDYKRFVRQIARFELRQLQTGALPDEWLPPVLNVTTTVVCPQSIGTLDLSQPSDAAFAYQALLALQTFGMFVNPYACADRNQRLYLRADGTMHCMCAPGHSCANEATYATVLEVLLIIFIVAFVLWAASQFHSTFTMTARLKTAVDRLDAMSKT